MDLQDCPKCVDVGFVDDSEHFCEFCGSTGQVCNDCDKQEAACICDDGPMLP